MTPRLPIQIALALATLLLGACSSVPKLTNYLAPYRVDVRQGNYISQEMVAQLKPGQTRDQVRFILGTPLVADQFHGDRWDYIYWHKPGRGELEQRRLVVHFDGNRLSRLDGDVTAATGAAAAGSPIRTVEIPGPRTAEPLSAPAAQPGN